MPLNDKERLKQVGRDISLAIEGTYRDFVYKDDSIDIQAQSRAFTGRGMKGKLKEQLYMVSDFLEGRPRGIRGWLQIAFVVVFTGREARKSADSRRLGKNWYKTVYREWASRGGAFGSAHTILENVELKRIESVNIQYNLNWNAEKKRPNR